MLTLSEDEYRDLERTVNTEVHKVFRQFLIDHKIKTARPGGTVPEEPEEPARPRTPRRSVAQQSGPGKHRRSKKLTDINRILERNAPGKPSAKKILEDDMDKIFRKKSRNRSR